MNQRPITALRLATLALLASAATLSACASPNYTMGPDWARYVGGTYRHREMVASSMSPETAAPPAAVATQPMASAAPTQLTYDAPRPVAMPPQAVAPHTQAVSVATNKGVRTARSVPIPSRAAIEAASAPVPVAPPPPPAVVVAPVAAPPTVQVSVPAPVVISGQATDTVGDTPSPPAARRFLRLRITGMESQESDPMEVRRQLRAVDGVKEVVLSFKTKTAIVVVDKAVSTETIIAALAAPYGAEMLN